MVMIKNDANAWLNLKDITLSERSLTQEVGSVTVKSGKEMIAIKQTVILLAERRKS